MWYINTMGYYSAKKDETMNFAGKWIKLGKITFSEVIQIQRDKQYIFFLIVGSKLQIFRCEYVACINYRNQETKPLLG